MKGMKNVNIIYQGDHKHVTFVGCVNAAGGHITPMLIYKGKYMKARLMEGYPEAIQKMTDSGFITNEVWYDWVQLFIKETGGNCTLVADWHTTRAYLPALELLRDANVKLVVLQPHTTHLCQPCDVTVFRSFKGHLRTEVSRRRGLAKYIDIEHISGLCKLAWNKAMEITKDEHGNNTSPAIRGFEKTGIYPFNPAKITKDMTHIADDLLARADAARALEEAQEAREDGLPAPGSMAKRGREDGEDDEGEGDDEEQLQGAEAEAAVDAVLAHPVPITVRLAKLNKGKHRKARLLTGDEAAEEFAAIAEAKAAAEEAKAERKRERAAKKASAGARIAKKQKPKKPQLLSHLLSPAALPGSSSSSSSAASSGAPAAAPAAMLFTPPVAAGAGVVVGFGGGGSDFLNAMETAASL
jgi:hypothetical protein